MQAIKSDLEIHAPEVNQRITERRINLWFDHAAYQLKTKRRAAEENLLRNETKANKENTYKSIRHTRPNLK